MYTNLFLIIFLEFNLHKMPIWIYRIISYSVKAYQSLWFRRFWNMIKEYKYLLKYTIKVSKENAIQLLNKFYINQRLRIKSSTSDVSKAFVWTVYLNHINVEKRKMFYICLVVSIRVTFQLKYHNSFLLDPFVVQDR